jgi:hypothetical protein
VKKIPLKNPLPRSTDKHNPENPKILELKSSLERQKLESESFMQCKILELKLRFSVPEFAIRILPCLSRRTRRRRRRRSGELRNFPAQSNRESRGEEGQR